MTILITTGCYDEEDYDLTSTEAFNKMTVDISSDSIPADGNSKVTFSFKFPSNADSELTVLRFITTNGTFLESKNDTLNVNYLETANFSEGEEDRKEAVATLVASTTPGESKVTVRVLNYEKDYTIIFNEASPTAVSLSSSTDYIKNDTIQEIDLTALVNSTAGVASQGTAVKLSFSPQTSGFFKNYEETKHIITLKSNSLGKVQPTFVFSDISYKGDITFTAKVDEIANEESKSDDFILRVID
jgi:hypothetical protein